ncbi:MAG: enoyl-CoA hydratase/isomerase family protein [Alphaproteobacteria bacterium]|nr:enoyl-CoA hydratase/isomerase family protein [Alphaproteobacteria bacterium]
MSTTVPFQNIAVIGAGTMGSGIAGQIANAGHHVLLLDLPRDDDANGATKAAVDRLLKSDPPALMHKSRAELITTGNTRDDFDKLAQCDWIIEAVVERLDIKKDLYQRLDDVISPDCVVTSNTSTIPIRLLVEDMNEAFRKRFAITHYFNPVRYMRLLELVEGEDTDPAIMAKLADYNDRILGKGVVPCRDTPGFLGNRVGVYALQVGMDEAHRLNLDVEVADALMGRPMGIPKTGVFGLYDLIGVDLMADVVKTLGTILPDGDVFHAVGENNPVAGLIAEMVSTGYTGDKGKGGFYRSGDNGEELAVDLATGAPRPRHQELPPKAQRAAATMAQGGDALMDLIHSTDDGDADQVRFSRNVLARVLGYAASLIPDVTTSPQDIDDAMKLGFNWVRGPFEMIDAIGAETLVEMIRETGGDVPAILTTGHPFYDARDGVLNVRRFDDAHSEGTSGPVRLPEGTIRFHMTKQCLEPIARNEAASLYALEGDLRLVEFHSKANALTAASMDIIFAATKDHGRGIIIHNDAQHFSAGVDLNGFLAMIRARDLDGIDAFLAHFQQAVKALRDTPVPVVAAPSGLTLGGGYEVVVHADKVIAHGNIVMGLVEAAVGVVPGGGGVKETFARWHNSTGDWAKSAWKTWMQIGYARTGTSPEQSASMQYFLNDRDVSVMNRDKLVAMAMAEVERMHDGYHAPAAPRFVLPGNALLKEMSDFMDKGIADGLFFPHDKTVAMAVASIVVSDDENDTEATEDEIFARERRAFLQLAQTKETEARIVSMLEKGEMLRN